LPAAVVTLGALAIASPAHALSSGYGAGRDYCESYGSWTSSYSYRNVYACGSVDSNGPTPFDSAGSRSFQCVELSARFLWVMYGIWAGPGTGVSDGADLVAVVHSEHPSIAVGTASPDSLPAAGDVISLGPGGGADPAFGHTAVVIDSDPVSGRFTIMSQNLPVGGAGEQTLEVDLGGGHDGQVLLDGVWTRASWLELAAPPAPACVVPRLHGLTVPEARRTLLRAHCRLARVFRRRPLVRRHHPRVVKQGSHPGHRHVSGWGVDVTVR
jgi:hypothetical protein